MAYDKERIDKILRMLESEHDGECAAAARRLTAMAKAEGHNLLEMVIAVYSGAGGSSKASGASSDNAYTKTARDFDDIWEAMVKRGFEQAKRNAEEARRREDAKRQGDPTIRGKIELAFTLAKTLGFTVLTAWENEFLGSIRFRGHLSTNQLDRLDEILEKLQRIKASRDRDADFWASNQT